MTKTNISDNIKMSIALSLVFCGSAIAETLFRMMGI